MKTDRLQRLLADAISIDCECAKIQPGLLAPPVVCAAIARVVDGKLVGELVDRQESIDRLLAMLKDSRVTIVNLNIAFDMLVIAVDAARLRGLDLLPYIFAAYAEGRVYDPGLAECLHHIGIGRHGYDPDTGAETYYSLDDVHRMVTGKVNAKVNDKWRMSYWLLRDTPIDQWPIEAVQYPKDDACNALEDALAQCGLIPNAGRHMFMDGACTRCNARLVAGLNPICRAKTVRLNLHDLANQSYNAFTMLLGATWGLLPDPVAVARLKYDVTKDLAKDIVPFQARGLIREDGTECQSILKRLVAIAYGADKPCEHCGKDVRLRGRKNAKYEERAPAGKVINATGKDWVNCDECDGTGLELNVFVPRAPKGGVSKGRDQLNESGDDFLLAYAEFGEKDKIRETYIPWLESAIDPRFHLVAPTKEELEWCIDRIDAAGWAGEQIVKPITLNPRVLGAETTRASFGDKTQTMPRKGGVRNCLVPEQGHGFYSCDYTGIEMAAWAQICIWMGLGSDLGDALNTGVNAHGKLGAQMCGMDYAEFMRLVKSGSLREKDFRQCAKWGNFGFMGGAGARRLVVQVREQGEDTPHPLGPISKKDGKRYYKGTRFCLLIGGAERCSITMSRSRKTRSGEEPAEPVCAKCLECAEWIRATWFTTWREAKPYFAKITEIARTGKQVHPTSKRLRGGVGFTDCANGYFQELAAVGAKASEREIVREQLDASYIPPDLTERSLMYAVSRNIALIHDENFGTGELYILPEVAERVCVVMKREMIIVVPDVRVEVEPTIMGRWYKEAAMVRDANGRLAMWHPKERH